MRRLVAVVVVALSVTTVLGACTREEPRAAGRLTVDGRAEVATLEGDLVSVTGARTLRSGEEVRLVEGTGLLGLGDDRAVEIETGTSLRLLFATTSTGRTEPRAELLTGDVLVSSNGAEAMLDAGRTVVTVSGVARVTRSLAVSVAVYRGSAGVESDGRSVSVPALRQVTVPAPGLPSRATPLSPSPSDRWDQRFLGDAVDLGNQLAALSRGFSAQLSAGEGTSAAFFRRLLPGLAEQPFDDTFIDPAQPGGEVLVGAAIAVAGTRGNFVTRWADVFAFHADGASWGLVALDQSVDRAPLLASVDAAIARYAAPPGSELAGPAPSVGPVPPTTAPSGVATTLPPTTVTAGPPTTTTATTAPSSGGGPGGGSPGGGVPGADRGPIDLGLPVVDDTLNVVVDTLSGLLRSLGG
ncbi:MAG: hypothetical protein AB1673_02010 [Actinomycetota bacterium]